MPMVVAAFERDIKRFLSHSVTENGHAALQQLDYEGIRIPFAFLRFWAGRWDLPCERYILLLPLGIGRRGCDRYRERRKVHVERIDLAAGDVVCRIGNSDLPIPSAIRKCVEQEGCIAQKCIDDRRAQFGIR